MDERGRDRWDEDELTREGGYFVPKNGGHRVGCDDEAERCAPDGYPEDPVEDRNVPGTVDDLDYDYGVETPPAADQSFDTVTDGGLPTSWDAGVTGPADEGDEAPALGKPEERELWRKQRPLIEESDREEQHYAGLSPEQARRVHEALAEDAEETLPEGAGGESATGGSSAGESKYE